MAICPFATYRPIDARYLSGRRMAVYNRMNLHVAGSFGSLFGFFNAAGRPSSHFWVDLNGGLEQYIDTALQAEADLEGNDATISVETSGKAEGPWTDEQVATLARLFRWAMDTHGLLPQLATSALPGLGSKGLSWHRLGIDGNFPPGLLAGRLQRGGGMHYSTSRGKVCPGDDRIRQIPGILALAVGGVVPVVHPVEPPPVVVVPPPARPARNVPETQATQRALHLTPDGDWGDGTDRALNLVRAAINGGHSADAQRVIGTTPDGIWGPKSRAALTRTIAALQRAWGVGDDGIWGPVTEAAYQRARERNYKAWER